ncbi:MAG: polysaccharide deacetylase family protein [Patescibacteria group bacterium]
MTFGLRIDLESDKGIRYGVPNLLKLLREFGFKASFYVTMGGESGIFEILKYRGPIPGAGERKVRIFSLFEKLRIALFPKDFVTSNVGVLRQILADGHELGIHGWKHRAWTRALDKIDYKKHIGFAVRKYIRLFKKKPDTFCSPGFRTNKKVIEYLDHLDFKVISDLPEFSKIFRMANVPITIKGKNNTPIIESGGSFEYIKDQIQKQEPAIMYIHGMYECIRKLGMLRKIFEYLRDNKIQVKTIREIGK